MGDISRRTFDPKKHYSGVLQQQGRVQVDADWNEQLAIQHHRTQTETVDVIGQCGAPRNGGGFKIEAAPNGADVTISPGRIYVGGLLCELESTAVAVTFTQGDQAVPPNQAIVASLIVDGRALQSGQWVTISAANQPDKLLQITAVSGLALSFDADVTAYRSAGATIRRVTTYLTQPDFPNPDFSTVASSPPTSPPTGQKVLNLSDGVYLVYLDAWQREVTALDDPRIREVALGGPDTATRLRTVWQVRFLPVKSNANAAPSCETDFPEWNALIAPATGRLNARTKVAEDPKDPCLLPPGAGYRRLENQLYRVEVHTSGSRDTATFKWSRDNATVETIIEQIAGNVITVTDVGRDEVLGFANGQWVEMVDDESELKSAPRPLVQISNVDKATRRLTLSSSLASLAGRTRLKLRRWDQSGNTASAAGVKLAADWLELESGVQVLFAEGTYRAGDYWLIPARTATGDVEWPPFEVPNNNPIPQPPAGVRHHFCRLALAEVKGRTISLRDCRKQFQPLTEFIREPGIRVTAINLLSGQPLRNDTDVPVTDLVRGLRIICDADPDQASVRNNPVCIVTFEMPFPFNNVDRELWGDPVIGFQSLILLAGVNSDNDSIFWVPAPDTRKWMTERLFQMMRELKRGDSVLARLTLKGNFIWARTDPTLYLDGEVFGFRQGANTDIRLPSGNNLRGGDLEMWFRVVPPPAPSLLKINRIRILAVGPNPANPNPAVLGNLSNFNPPGLTVPFTPTAPPNAIEVQFSAPPDPNTVVPNQSFIVLNAATGAAMPGQILFTPDSSTVRWVAQVAGAAGLTPGAYRIALRGSVIASQGSLLDGELVGLPSGNNTPGGDAVFTLQVG